MTECGECARNLLRLHTIEVELEHRERVIADLRNKVDELKDQVEKKKAGKK